jgi:hypothetical protein
MAACNAAAVAPSAGKNDSMANSDRVEFRPVNASSTAGAACRSLLADALSASRQLSSETPKFSNIISDRSHPGVMETAVPLCGPSSCPKENASRFTATFARS